MMKAKLLLVLASLALLQYSVCSYAADHYILAGASGDNSGSNWTNACANLTGSCAPTTRGDTYYVGTGAYSGFNFSVALQGTTPVTVKGAIATDHGTDIGWSDSLGVDVSQATFTGGFTIGNNTGYLVINGNTGDPRVSDANMGF